MKKVLKFFAVLIAICVVLVAALLIFLQVNEYKPAQEEEVSPEGNAEKTVREGDTLRVMTFNIGYGALDQDQDFFMDGGKKVNGESRQKVLDNMQGIADIIYDNKADVTFLQEVDRDSKRSYHIDEAEYLMEAYPGCLMTYAPNFRCPYIPYPFPTIGKVEGGLVTLNQFEVSEAQRISLPNSFSWPIRLCQLKRCLLVQRVPVEDSAKELVLVNLHLEAYDDGEGKEAQTQVLFDFLKEEYEKGNYVIAGGDFNQMFDEIGLEEYPLTDVSHFRPGSIDTSGLGEGWAFVNDTSVPTSRLLNEAYDPQSEDTQYYVIDGFILSPNVTMEKVKTLDRGFVYADHNPVSVRVTLQKEQEEGK
ncbi:MAG: endonuclease/exonuclease/phosphatase family protein [Ruminococcus sp.]|jgi:endonuclease/exonuclease/phosphatase family metal-dependent hydrolase